MKDRNKTIQVLQYLSLIFTGLTSFIGLIYLSRGETLISFFIAAVFIFSFYFIIQQMILRKGEIKKKKFSKYAIIFSFLYLVFSIPLSFSILHFFSVEIGAKSEIVLESKKKIKDLDDMVIKYKESASNFCDVMSSKQSNLLDDYISSKDTEAKRKLMSKPFLYDTETLNSINSSNKADFIDTKKRAKKNKFISNIKKLERDNKEFLNNGAKSIVNWSRLNLVGSFYELDKRLASNYRKLDSVFVVYSENYMWGQSYSYSFNKSKIPLDEPITLFKKYKSYSSLIFILLFHVFLLLPYWLTETEGVYKKHKKRGQF